MNLQNDSQSLALMKFGIGQPVPRTEDPTLVRGHGCYTDDIKLPREAYAVMVRSRHAHGVIKGIDTSAAKSMPGVLGVYTGADLTAYGPLKCIVPFNNRDGSPMRKPLRPALPTDKVRFVGDPVACVVAETVLQAKDAAEAVELDIDPLPAVTRPERGGARGRAAALRRCAGQRRARLPLRRQRAGQGRLRQGRACHAHQARQQPRGRERHGAARGDRRLRSGERALHAACAARRACSACAATWPRSSRSSRSRSAS